MNIEGVKIDRMRSVRRFAYLFIALACVLALQFYPALADDTGALTQSDRVQALIDRGEFDNALVSVESALKQNRKNQRLLLQRGEILVNLNRLDSAAKHYKKVMRRFKDSPEAVNNLALVYRLQGNYLKSIELFSSLIDGYPGYIEGYQNLADTHLAYVAKSLKMAEMVNPDDALVSQQFDAVREAEQLVDMLVVQRLANVPVDNPLALTEPLPETAIELAAQTTDSDRAELDARQKAEQEKLAIAAEQREQREAAELEARQRAEREELALAAKQRRERETQELAEQQRAERQALELARVQAAEQRARQHTELLASQQSEADRQAEIERNARLQAARDQAAEEAALAEAERLAAEQAKAEQRAAEEAAAAELAAEQRAAQELAAAQAAEQRAEIEADSAERAARKADAERQLAEDSKELALAAVVVKPAAITEEPTEKVFSVLDSWSKAWSSKDTDLFFAHYARDFTPSYNLSVDSWKGQKRAYIKKAGYINVQIEDLSLTQLSDNEVVAKFIERYESDRTTHASQKTMRLSKFEDGRWLIVSEKDELIDKT